MTCSPFACPLGTALLGVACLFELLKPAGPLLSEIGAPAAVSAGVGCPSLNLTGGTGASDANGVSCMLLQAGELRPDMSAISIWLPAGEGIGLWGTGLAPDDML